ncbi:hypothetical protein [Fibrella aquatilis]|uniref:Uncharacterized protein n=1 Tax=Fibrella aquatilis TaxID=2817059 RepID=A0A939G9T7_9BACT|nr:hypothetical protein [Fibrella aquatilis]MBO0933299.1 hypothetical protein [Fibrella aquatilis]
MENVNPYISVNSIYFGMQPFQVESNLGKADRIKPVSAQEFYELRDVFTIYYTNNVVTSIIFNELVDLHINGKLLSFAKDIKTVLDTEDPFFVNDNYVFPQYGLNGYGLDHPENGVEIIVYAKSMKSYYEKDINSFPRHSEIFSKENIKNNDYTIIPYRSVGRLLFGSSPDDIEKAIGRPNKKNQYTTGELSEVRQGVSTKYNKYKRLIQVRFSRDVPVFLNDVLISDDGDKSAIFKHSEIYLNRAYKIYFEYGIAFTGYDSHQSDNGSIIVFSEELISFWKNKFRPLL